MGAEFKRLVKNAQGWALYVAEDLNAPANVDELKLNFYFLFFKAEKLNWAEPPESLTYEESWSAIGVYIFSKPFRVKDLTPLENALGVSPTGVNNRGFAWVEGASNPEPSAQVVPITWNSDSSGQVTKPSEIDALNVGLQFSGVVNVNWDFAGSSVVFVNQSAGASGIQLTRGELQQALVPEKDQISINLDPANTTVGIIQFSANWNAQNFFSLFKDDPFDPNLAFGGEIRYFSRAKKSSTVMQLVYPLYAPPALGIKFKLSCSFDPLAPTDAVRTFFKFTDGVGPPDTVTSNFARAITGDTFTLKPPSDIGFYLGRRVNTNADDEPQTYLAPTGRYRVSLEAAPDIKLMCGLSGLEYLKLNDGDFIDLHPNKPAYADFNDATSALDAFEETGEAPTLGAEFTTSWVSISAANKRSSLAESGPNYFSQPIDGAYFNHDASTITSAPLATAARVTAAEDAAPFPMAFYGGVYPTGDDDADGWPNSRVDGLEFDSFESNALTPTRYEIMTVAAGNAGPTLCDSDGEPLLGGRSATPTGFLVNLGDGASANTLNAPATPAGSWERLVLGKSDLGELAFNAGDSGEVDVNLSRAFLNSQSFTVLSDWSKFPPAIYESLLRVQQIDVRLSPTQTQLDPRSTIIVFKYADTETLQELLERVDAWDNPAWFVGSTPQVESAQAIIRQSIADAQAAKDTPGKPFDYFLNTVVSTKSWTGLLVFNAPVDGRNMPPDFQMILGGIDGPLRAHHFGIETNKLNNKDGSDPDIEKTSFLGVFFHLEREPPPPKPDQPFGFRTTELIIVIRNSAIAQFRSEISITLNQLFGRAVVGEPAEKTSIEVLAENDEPNSVRLKGEYQTIDGIGRVIFDGELNRAFAFNSGNDLIRVIDRFQLKGATMSPIKNDDDSPNSGDVSEVTARISINGEIIFNRAPFPANKGEAPLDLFTYGEMVDDVMRGLPVSGFSLDINFKLGANGREGGINIAPNFNNLKASEYQPARRKEGLVSGFPLQLKTLLSKDTGLETVTSSAKPLNVPALIAGSNANAQDDPGVGVKVDLNTVPLLDATTPTPQFALEFELPLGSLGDLAETGVGLSAGLVLGWGPSASTPDSDGIALFVQLPGLVGGLAGFDLQGFVKTTFGAANLARVVYSPDQKMNDDGVDVKPNSVTEERGVYVILFNNVALSILGIQLPPKVITDFVLFSDPNAPGSSNIAWSLAATQVQSDEEKVSLDVS